MPDLIYQTDRIEHETILDFYLSHGPACVWQLSHGTILELKTHNTAQWICTGDTIAFFCYAEFQIASSASQQDC